MSELVASLIAGVVVALAVCVAYTRGRHVGFERAWASRRLPMSEAWLAEHRIDGEP